MMTLHTQVTALLSLGNPPPSWLQLLHLSAASTTEDFPSALSPMQVKKLLVLIHLHTRAQNRHSLSKEKRAGI